MVIVVSDNGAGGEGGPKDHNHQFKNWKRYEFNRGTSASLDTAA